MPTYNKTEIGQVARQYGFVRDTFEKVLRLKEILRYLNEEEYNKLAKICESSNLPRSTVIRKMILGHTIRLRPNMDFAKLHAAIGSIGININQIARKTNQMHLTGNDLKQVKSMLAAVLRELDRWRQVWEGRTIKAAKRL